MSKASRLRIQSLDAVEAVVESLAQDGRGVAHVNGKTVFIHGALPRERVRFIYEKLQARFDSGKVQEILEAAPDRVTPRCKHFGVCGGCSLQHLRADSQIHAKEQILRDALKHLGKVQPTFGYLPPLVADHWGYRGKARLGVKYVKGKGRLLVGFRERNTSLLADITQCEVLHPKLGLCLEALQETLAKLSICNQVPQVEMSMGDGACVLIIRVLAAPSVEDTECLRHFGATHDLIIYLQPGGPQSLIPLGPTVDLGYTLPDLNLHLHFQPLDFTQVHIQLNRLLVNRVLELLNPQPQEHILDLFCGIGNFTLPLATRAGMVIGVEGDAGLVARAQANAVANGLQNCQFYINDLYSSLEHAPWIGKTYDQILLDPPRSGAAQVLPYLAQLGARRILYISCLPATLARDAGLLVHEYGYILHSAGVMDMFPHTAHVESLAVFERE